MKTAKLLLSILLVAGVCQVANAAQSEQKPTVIQKTVKLVKENPMETQFLAAIAALGGAFALTPCKAKLAQSAACTLWVTGATLCISAGIQMLKS
jgi:hypothetical protein